MNVLRKIRWEHRKNSTESGQYMVEFGLTFIIFVFIILGCINLILAGYNYDTAQWACWTAARKAVVGGTNGDVTEIIYNQYVERFFSSPMLISAIEFNQSNFINPIEQINRSEGISVTVQMNYRTGLSLGYFGNIEMPFKVSSTLTVIAENDADRDGYVDSLEDAYIPLTLFSNDHDNDGVADGSDSDVDGDGRADEVDTAIISSFGNNVFTLQTFTNGVLASTVIMPDDRFAARQIWTLSNADTFAAPWPMVPRAMPADPTGVATIVLRDIDLRYDADNDGWEDKFDAFDGDPTKH